MLNENRLYSISLGVASLQDGLVGIATALSPAMAGHFKFLLHHFFVRLGLIVVGEWDALVTGTQAVFGQLNNTPYKRLIQIGEGTHLVFLEKNRMHLFREVQLFLDEPRSAN